MNLTTALITVLQRSYLEDVVESPARWVLRPLEAHGDEPILREVVGMHRSLEDTGASMTLALGALHNFGHNVIMRLAGDGSKHRLWYGLRRRAESSIVMGDALDAMTGIFRAQLPDSRLGDWARGDDPQIAGFLEAAPAVAVMTGIPRSARKTIPINAQGVDRVVAAMQSRRYALIVVAEPLSTMLLEESMSACRAITEQLHPLLSMSLTTSSGESNQTSRQQIPVRPQSTILQLAEFVAFANAFSAPFAGAARMYGVFNRSMQRPVTESITTVKTATESENQTITVVDADARYCHALVQAYHDRLASARDLGWWRQATYLVAEDQATLHLLAQTLRSISVSDQSSIEPLRLLELAPHRLREAMLSGTLLDIAPKDRPIHHPLGRLNESLATCTTTDELATLVAPPRRDVPGMRMRENSEFALGVPSVEQPAIVLGELRDSAGGVLGPVSISMRTLNEHVMVVGTPGSGKTNTCMHLLAEAYATAGTPFLVLEPAKAEYRSLSQITLHNGERPLAGKLRVYSLDSTKDAALRINPLRHVPGVSLMSHIDMLKMVFNASFGLFPGMPQVLERALIDVYESRGWNLATGENDVLGPKAAQDDIDELTPCLRDLHDQIDLVLRAKGYREDIHQNMDAALRSRIESLMLGTKGTLLNTRRSTSLSDLFEHPVVLELAQIRDNEEKAFVMSLICSLLYQYCERRQREMGPVGRTALQHITLVEEAHRLLSAPPAIGPDMANSRSKAVEMFTELLAEVRAYGEAFIVAEQIPSKLASDVFKNTNTKIVHRLAAAGERRMVGESLDLSERQTRALSSLSKGLAVVHGLTGELDGHVAEPALVQIASVKETLIASADRVNAPTRQRPSRELLKLAGCASCSDPCSFAARIDRLIRSNAFDFDFRDLVESILFDDFNGAFEAYDRWRRTLRSSFAGVELLSGHLHCAFIHAAAAWEERAFKRGIVRRSEAGRIVPRDRLIMAELNAAFGSFERSVAEGSDAIFDSSLSDLRSALISALERSTFGAGDPRFAVVVATRDLTKTLTELSEVLPSGENDRFGNGVSIEGRIGQITTVLEAALQVRRLPILRTHYGALAYHLVTNLSVDENIQPAFERLRDRLRAESVLQSER